MSEETIIRHASPTLAGIKTGSMFTEHFSSREELYAFVRNWNIELLDKGIRMLPLRYSKETALIYIYRPSKLIKDLDDSVARRLLNERGYEESTPERCIYRLIERLQASEEFPHEIGLFLGYPSEDVCGFIENKAMNCKCVGCWKVYGNEEAAKHKFELYRKCTDVYNEQLAKGISIRRLTVAG